MQSLDILRRYDIVLCDIDGVLHTGRDGVAGVPELLGALRSSGPEVTFLTNNGSALPEQIVAWLGSLGLEIPLQSLVTAGEVLVPAFRDRALVGQPIINLGNEPAAEYVRRAGGMPIPAAQARRCFREAKAIVVGSTRGLDKDVLDAACNAIRANDTSVLCTNPDPFAPAADGEITLVAGGIANLLERELGARVERLGKPHRPIFDLALSRVAARHGSAPPRVLVVDDNMDSGILGGASLGFDTLLVLSGWHRNAAEAETAMRRLGVRPTYVLPAVTS